jgi:MoaA/NifB/PqqE/SkfB family radical SAM enzyme
MAYPLRDVLRNIYRAFHLIRIINFNSEASIGPIAVQVGLTTACNYRCYFCRVHSCLKKDVLPSHTLSEETIGNFLEDIKFLKVREIIFAGDGEQFLHPKLPQIIDACAGLKVSIVTNGSRLGILSASMFSKVQKLTVSLNSINDETHRLIHGYKGPSQLPYILGNIERLIGLPGGPGKLQINYCIGKNNLNDLKKVFRLSAKWNVFFAVHPLDAVMPELESEAMSAAQTAEGRGVILKLLTKRFLPRRTRISLRHALHRFRSDKPYSPRSSLLPCYAGFYMPFIIGNGDYHICCYCMERMGNIDEKRMRDIWKSDSLQKIIYSTALIHENNKAVCPSCFKCEDVKAHSSIFHRFFSRIPYQTKLLRYRYKQKHSI